MTMKPDIVGLYYHAMLDSRYLCRQASDELETRYQVSRHHGAGCIRHVGAGDGLDFSCWDTVSAENLYLKNLRSNQDVLQIIYCLNGQMTVQVGPSQELVLAAEDVLFYDHQQALPDVAVSTRNYSGISIHVHRYYVQQLLGAASASRLNTQWPDTIRCLLANEPILVRQAPLSLQLAAGKLNPPGWSNMTATLTFQARILEFLGCCLLCADRSTPAGTLTQGDIATVYQAKQYLLEHLDDPPSVKKLAWLCQTNSDKLQKDFKAIYHTTLYAFVKIKRLEKSQQLLKQTDASIAAIANQIGYSNPSKFASAFREYTGMTPSEYKRSH